LIGQPVFCFGAALIISGKFSKISQNAITANLQGDFSEQSGN
jgi:hypothetical protein